MAAHGHPPAVPACPNGVPSPGADAVEGLMMDAVSAAFPHSLCTSSFCVNDASPRRPHATPSPSASGAAAFPPPGAAPPARPLRCRLAPAVWSAARQNYPATGPVPTSFSAASVKQSDACPRTAPPAEHAGAPASHRSFVRPPRYSDPMVVTKAPAS